MSAVKLSILKPSVNCMSARVLVRAAGLEFEEPDMWGMMLVDIARHAARAFAKEGVCSEEEALARIVEMFENELQRPTDPGSTSPVSKQGH